MKKLMILLIASVLFISGCNVDEKLVSNVVKENIDQIVVCNEPYIRYASECCLDANSNKICDRDESSDKKEVVVKEPKETPK